MELNFKDVGARLACTGKKECCGGFRARVPRQGLGGRRGHGHVAPGTEARNTCRCHRGQRGADRSSVWTLAELLKEPDIAPRFARGYGVCCGVIYAYGNS